MLKSTSRVVCFLLCAFACLSKADASIAFYDFETAPPESATTSDPLVTASAITTNNLTGSFGYAAGLGYPSPTVAQVNPPTTLTAADAVAGDEYFSFTVTPTAGATLDLTDLTFDAARGGGGTPRGWEVRSSVDGFASSLGTADIPTARPALTSFSVNLGAASFDNLTSAVEFRFYSYSPNSNNSVEYDNIELNGTAALVAMVPEPASGLLVIVASTGLLLRRRR